MNSSHERAQRDQLPARSGPQAILARHPRSIEAALLELQRMIGNASVTALLTGTLPTVQRRIGWPAPVGTKNDDRHTIAGVDRYPIYGLTGGNQLPRTPKPKDPKKEKDNSWMDHDAIEKADKRAIVLIPQGLKPEAKPDVLFELHGHYIGWREGKVDNEDSGAVKGNTRDQSAEGIVQSLPRNMIAVLPQGTAKSWFGNIDPTSYIAEALAMIEGWEGAKTGRLLFSAHSGGGGTLDPRLGPPMEKADKKWEAGRAKRQADWKAKLPAGLREIALFDAINGANEFNSVFGWLLDSITTDIETLKGMKEADQAKYVDSIVVFRGYYEKGYAWAYKPLQELRESLLKPEQRPNEISNEIWEELRNHYVIQGPIGVTHHQMVKQNLPAALDAMNLKGTP